jgi:hypothetical protein
VYESRLKLEFKSALNNDEVKGLCHDLEVIDTKRKNLLIRVNQWELAALRALAQRTDIPPLEFDTELA